MGRNRQGIVRYETDRVSLERGRIEIIYWRIEISPKTTLKTIGLGN